MNQTVDNYLMNGCGRCPLGGTPNCKVHRWLPELELLRAIVLKSGLTEESKWGVPCYSFKKKNVLIISAFKDFCSINFFKGVLLSDTKNILVKAGKNTQAARLMKFNNVSEIKRVEVDIQNYISEAIVVEKAGIKVELKSNPEPIPEELEKILKDDAVLKTAFEALTPGRQRGYILYFSAPKQSKTRVSRIEKSMGKILKGEGLHDKYKRQ